MFTIKVKRKGVRAMSFPEDTSKEILRPDRFVYISRYLLQFVEVIAEY